MPARGADEAQRSPLFEKGVAVKRPPLATGFFVLVLLFLIGTGLVAPRDPQADADVMQAEERHPLDAHLALYQEHRARMEQPGDCR